MATDFTQRKTKMLKGKCQILMPEKVLLNRSLLLAIKKTQTIRKVCFTKHKIVVAKGLFTLGHELIYIQKIKRLYTKTSK